MCKEYNRENITVWGSRSSAVTEKCFKEVSTACFYRLPCRPKYIEVSFKCKIVKL